MDLGSDSVLALDLSGFPTCQRASSVGDVSMVYGSFRGFGNVFMGLTSHLI